jgi:tRNA (guanosine-2'-O-)-methyltransferase
MTPDRFRTLKSVLARRQPDLTILSENVHKTHNLAAIVRSCDAVGVFQAHVVSNSPKLPRHHLTSAGSGKWVPLVIHPDIGSAIESLKKDGFQVFAAHLSDRSVDFRSVDYTAPTALLLGSELVGVTAEAADMADAHLTIPMQGHTESLNVSVANALILYEAMKQREAAGMYDNSRLEKETWQKTLFEWSYPDIARRCRDKKLPYPALSDEGQILENPFA